eukprot:2309659-Prymnesium_polylepis.1
MVKGTSVFPAPVGAENTSKGARAPFGCRGRLVGRHSTPFQTTARVVFTYERPQRGETFHKAWPRIGRVEPKE